MIRRESERKLNVVKMFNGDGEAQLHHILHTNEEMYNKGRVFSHVTLNPGCEVGWHIHHGDGETYYILKGEADYNDNGTVVKVGPGDVTFVDDGEGHSIKNNGTEPVELIALILFK